MVYWAVPATASRTASIRPGTIWRISAVTSSTSSEDPGAPLATRRFPPRDQLPPGVTVEFLRGLGTTWYERGFSYWARRIGVMIGLAAIVALWTVIVGAIIHHAGPAGSPAFIAILTAEIVVSLVTGVWEFRRNWAHPSRWTSRDDDRARTAGAWAGGLGSLIRTGNILVVVPIVLGRGERLWDGLEALEDHFQIEAVNSPSGVTHVILSRR
jgi:hypothetical protein